MSFNTRYTALRENPDTARAGMPWTNEEEAKLMEHVTSNMDMENIAKTHMRTITGVKSHIMSNALKMVKTNNMSLDDISKHVHIPLEDLKAFKQREDEKKQRQNKKKEKLEHGKDKYPNSAAHPKISMQNDDKYMQVLIEIRDLLKVVSGKQ